MIRREKSKEIKMTNDDLGIMCKGGELSYLVTIKLSPAELDRLKDFAAAQGIGVAELCERIVRAECGSKVDERPE